MASGTPDIFDYSDYRILLRDCYQSRRETRPGWGHKVWARQLGLKSPSTLVMILKGRRNPSPRLAAALVKWMRLDPERAGYFHDLIQFERSRKDLRMSAFLMGRLRERNTKGEFRFVEADAFASISEWHYCAIREMVQLESFQEDAHWICSHLKFPLSPKEVREAIGALLRMKLLQRGPGGKLELGSGQVEISSEVASQGIQRFHEQQLAHAARSLKSEPPARRDVRGTTFAMPHAKLAEARELIRKFHNDFCDLMEAKSSDAVYHLEIALFPVAETRGGKVA
jgi:uncharacterized protein (TIGR02147 family)